MRGLELMREAGYPYAFNPAACEACKGRCCTGEQGHIWINDAEIAALCALLGESETVVRGCYLRLEREGWSIRERQGESGYECYFFDAPSGRCRIYEARPGQCRTFPFWESALKHLDFLKASCPGVVIA
ncbi:MAG: YkgJ family cysteine cluster protein [Campylobacterales bacterium]